MSVNRPLPAEPHPEPSATRWLLAAVPAFIYAGSELAALWAGGNTNLWWTTLPVFFALPVAYSLVRTRNQYPAIVLIMVAIAIQSLLSSLALRGLGVPSAMIALALILAVGMGTLPRADMRNVILGGLAVAMAAILLDAFGSLSRPTAQLTQGRWIFSIFILSIFGIFVFSRLSALNIRTKVVLGILGTGGLALAVLALFAWFQTQQITDALSIRLDASVSQLAKEQLINTAFSQANQANQTFEDIEEEVASLAQNWTLLRSQTAILGQETYWDAESNLMRLEGGQHGNSTSDASSVFVPVGTRLDAALFRDLSVSAYLDFYAPAVLETHPSLLAIYAIDLRGVTRYYPNINLASLLPPDFDATQRPYFTITSPLFDPQRMPRWTIPYLDATGGGLVVTVAAPVYDDDRFVGVVAADMQLAQITQRVNAIQVGESGYAFMLDDAGRILSMPTAGYEMFGIRAEDMNREEFFKQTILGSGTDELQALTMRMTSGGNGLLITQVGGVETYVSYAPVSANGYSVALVVPVAELQGAIVSARAQTQQQIREATQIATVLLLGLLLVAVATSLALGRLIATPILRLTQVASEIAAGNLSAQATSVTNDEIGTLAASFNTMTARLRDTLDALEDKVQERTAALQAANERNERRARQFESIAEVARTISSTSELEVLLPQITRVISREFGFYHVGIFLLDTAKEYAVLSAANSEGGQTMLARGHRLKVGETGIVGYVTGTGNPRVALDTGADATFFNNPFLPETRSEIALPLRTGSEIIGALDVQSKAANAFSQEDISILSSLADQVSIAIQNARQFEQTRQALREAEALAKQFVQTGWQQFTSDKNLLGIRHTGARSTLLYGKNGKNQVDQTRPEDPVRPTARGATLSLPIELRGEVIGFVEARSPGNRPWDQDELDIVKAIIERSAIAMENARLLEASQRLASKEAKIGEVTARISSSINMRNILQAAVEELGRALPGSEVVIQFETEQNKNRIRQ